MPAHPFHKASFRPHLMLGAERKPMLMLAFACGGLAVTSYNLVALAIAAALWFVIHPLLIWMAKHDPDMIGIYFRNLLYPRYIPPFSTPFMKKRGYRIRN